jgi:hypothetical protein
MRQEHLTNEDNYSFNLGPEIQEIARRELQVCRDNVTRLDKSSEISQETVNRAKSDTKQKS